MGVVVDVCEQALVLVEAEVCVEQEPEDDSQYRARYHRLRELPELDRLEDRAPETPERSGNDCLRSWMVHPPLDPQSDGEDDDAVAYVSQHESEENRKDESEDERRVELVEHGRCQDTG